MSWPVAKSKLPSGEERAGQSHPNPGALLQRGDGVVIIGLTATLSRHSGSNTGTGRSA
jgi:hypothetical protein